MTSKHIAECAVNPILTLSDSHHNWCTGTPLNRIITAQWEGMGDVGLARYEPALLPPCPTIRVLSYSNCQRSTLSISKWSFRNSALQGLIDCSRDWKIILFIKTGCLLTQVNYSEKCTFRGPLLGDKVSMATRTYPHKPPRKIKVTYMQSPDLQRTYCVA